MRNVLFPIIIFFYSAVFARDVNVKDYGAVGDGKTLNSAFLQKAIDECSASGGGKVIFPEGIYLSGTILLKDHVTLHFQKGAKLAGSTNIEDYKNPDPFTEGLGIDVGWALVAAVDLKNIGIEGEGSIDGQGTKLKAEHILTDTRPEGKRWGRRPFLLRVVRCNGVTVKDITLNYAAAWTSHYFQSKNIVIENIKIVSVGVAHNDGIGIDGCQDVRIKNCDVISGDDALVFKTTSSKMACKNIVVTGMRLKSNQAGIKMGTESMAPFEDISITDCHIYDTRNGGIKLLTVDGAHLRNIEISGITMDNVRTPMLFRLGSRLNVFRKNQDIKQSTGTFTNVIIKNVRAKSSDSTQLKPASGILITGVPGHYITNLTLENIEIELPGGGDSLHSRVSVPEATDQYPEVKTFGPTIPAYGIWARHVKGLRLNNITFYLKANDQRPAFICEDGKDIRLSEWNIPVTSGAEAIMRLENVDGALIEKVNVKGSAKYFVKIEGSGSRNIRQSGNRLPLIKVGIRNGKEKTGLSYADNATHIGKITNDSIVVATGSTYAFTVDTPEDKGLVFTNTTVAQLMSQVVNTNGEQLKGKVIDKQGNEKEGLLVSGDRLVIDQGEGRQPKIYFIAARPMALSGNLQLKNKNITANSTINLTVYFTAGQRTPNATVRIFIPKGIVITPDNATVNIIGRGDVKLDSLSTQSIGRTGTAYPYKQVGNFSLTRTQDGTTVLLLKHLDLRPANGADLKIEITGVRLSKPGEYPLRAVYSTSKPEVLTSSGVGTETAILYVTQHISDLERIPDGSIHYRENNSTYTEAKFKWNASGASGIQMVYSSNEGVTWTPAPAVIDEKKSVASVSGLEPGKLYRFKLFVSNGYNKGYSNEVKFYSGKMDIKKFGATGDGNGDDTEKINEAILYLNKIGGGTLLFSEGTYNVRTVHLKSNVYLYVAKGATIRAIKGADAPETTWFSDKKYRSGLSPTDRGPYDDPENWLTKQDVGHHYFRNTMFFGERLENVKIIGNGCITGNGNLVTGDRVMNNTPDNRADKMFTLKLCTNVEIGGLDGSGDLWYDSLKDEPYYIRKDGSKDTTIDNMLQIDRGGHFVLLATGTDDINVHDTYFGRSSTANARDIYDFMQCNNVTATNIYCKVSSDDIIKLGSDCSLGFTRPAKNYKVRNIIGDTNCNLFQIGSETADDITDVCVDNIYVLGANKAGFSISTNDGAQVKDIHLNCGHTGKLHSRSKMLRATTPFFISISNRGRVLGANVSRFRFMEDTVKHDELLVTNVNIGRVENILINGVDITEVYGGSSYSDAKQRWKPYNGKQRRATPIIAGYSLPNPSVVENGLNFTLPNKKHTGYVKNISFTDVHVLVKGGNPSSDTAASPPELGVGQYNVSNLKVQPSYGLWARHVMNLAVKNCSFNYEATDNRYPLFLDDVIGATISDIKINKARDVVAAVKLKKCKEVILTNITYYSSDLSGAPKLNSTGTTRD
ncbi:MAG TPA: glycosyl hydrolase family 28 protein [Chitinophagaceae bacterium]